MIRHGAKPWTTPLCKRVRQLYLPVSKPYRVGVQTEDPELRELIEAEAFYASQGFETFDKTESFPKGRFLPVMKKSGHL